MQTYLQRLVDERISLTEHINRTADSAAEADRELTESEKTSIAGMQTRCTEIDPQLEQYNAQQESTRALRRVDGPPRIDPRHPRRVPHPAASRRGGVHVVGSAVRRVGPVPHLPRSGTSGRFPIEGFLEMRAAITTAQPRHPALRVGTRRYHDPRPAARGVRPRHDVGRVSSTGSRLGGDPPAAVVAEGTAKPEATFTATPKTAALDTIAHWVQITRQALDDAPYIRSVIEGKLRRGLLNKAEADMAAAIDASTAVQTVAGGVAPRRDPRRDREGRSGRVPPERRRPQPRRLRRSSTST